MLITLLTSNSPTPTPSPARQPPSATNDLDEGSLRPYTKKIAALVRDRAMEVEQKELIDYFARQGVGVQATSDPSLFAFSEILGFPSLAQVLPPPSPSGFGVVWSV